MIHRDERGVGREQSVFQAQVENRLAVRVAALQGLLVGQRGDPVTRPEMRQRTILRHRLGRIDRQLDAVHPGSTAALHQQAAGWLAAPLAKHHQRTLGEQIRQCRRLDLMHLQAVEADLRIGQQRRIDHLQEALGLAVGTGRIEDDEGLALPRPRQPLDQLAIDR